MKPPEQTGQPRGLPFVEGPAAEPAGGAAASTPLLSGLNEAQALAVTHGDGPLLVLAGAGSGKTRVITHRIAHLILDRRVPSSRIVAVTFTNKAAAEMRERVLALLDSFGERECDAWIGTFHSLCLRLLRREAARIDLDPRFVIYDRDDQLALVRRILKEEGEDDPGSPRSFLARISRAKNAMISPVELAKQAHTPDRQLAAHIYEQYQKALRQSQAVDFDDLLLLPLKLFDRCPEIAAGYAERCEHLLVDEYQDTNRPQYKLVRRLSARHRNVFVVGDEDQSIYRFRGAEIRNILDFERDHDATRTIRLEQNYRSTDAIVQAASAVIAHNVNRKGKTLWTENARGDKLELYVAGDDRQEAVRVAQRARELSAEADWEEMAVLYRTNAQSRLMEEIFRRDRIPYQIVGSVQFYDRKEVKDLLSYLKLVANPADDVAFRRVVNTPTRGIGDTTVAAVENVARGMGLPLLEAARHALDQHVLGKRPARMLGAFLALVDDLIERETSDGLVGLLEHLIEAVGYRAHLEKQYGTLAEDRIENVQALVSATVEYLEEDDAGTLQGFLDRSALVADADEVGGRPGVTLMTIHCAKGLEFPIVFLTGLEENLFPHAMSMGSDDDVEEERRLCYVAMTRARRRLLLSRARFRRMQGTLLPNPGSRFLNEVPQALVDEIASADGGFFDDWSPRESTSRYGSSAARAARARPAPGPAQPPARQPDPGDGFAVGAAVEHPRFGPGVIHDREGSGKHLKLTIHFAQAGTKKILPSYTQLTVSD